MYFEIENTPEHIKRSRRKEPVKPNSPKEVCPRLILAPFSRPPQVVFENVNIGSTCERELEIFNPSKQIQLITLGKALPIGLIIHLPGDWLEVEPETCYCLTISWTPMQPTALRETIRFSDESRGRFDVILVLKSAVNEKRKAGQTKGFKTSPGKMKKKQSKKSPVSIYKKKITKISKVQTSQSITQCRILQTSNKENISMYSIDSRTEKCPFDSPTSIDFKFDTSDVFPSLKKFNTDTYSQIHAENTYDATDNTFSRLLEKHVLKPSNNQNVDVTCTDIFENLTFTPLKSIATKNEKLEQGPKIILSLNSESDLDDSIENKNNENATHSIISITSSQPPNKWLTVNHHTQMDSQYIAETPDVQSKKIPNTSSPKELHSPNFSINTDFSRISDLSFFPPRFSTERKVASKFNNDTHDLLDEILMPKLHSDTYTKDSPHEPLDLRCSRKPVELKPPHFFTKDKMCRQSLFRESQQQMFDKLYMNPNEHNVWQNHLKVESNSPPRSLSPPLQTIPEENSHFGDTRTEKQMDTFTINRTFDRTFERASISNASRQSWSKKTIKAEQEIRKPPTSDKFLKPTGFPITKHKESLGRISTVGSNTTFDQNRSVLSMSQIGNVYSQSLTVDPFSSTSYFYDEEAVDKFGKEFKRWLNCILTPPADLESNIEQKVDVGKAWIENRNKEVPAAPTKEQVCSAYHNSHRLESLRRAAKALLSSPEMTLVFQKLNAQIEKKLIAVRTDRNLHLDVGLQKAIMELLLSYNPLWLRIGLEALYGIILPLKSNSDIEGLSTFIIQRLFKNPYLRNKHSKSNAPNMLLPAYMEAIKKYTLKKFFMLIFFLDQAKQRKLIPHDPCLFCRNAVCKESREVIIRFTREVIAGIGDITKHLRPLGYVVSHKQSYLDEYKYAVHNIAVDLRDGVRLTKVMEIILIRQGLLTMLRTPAISRLQKIHNVQVAFNALKEANFVIEGDIKPVDIADGHREKTLSLLWQLIHVFRAPLFEKAANVIQIWWRKKYEVIVEKRTREEQIRLKQIHAATSIQHWWRQIQYNRYMQWKIMVMTKATITLQKYFRMWICKIRLSKLKYSVRKIEQWYTSIKAVREAKLVLNKLKVEREQQRQNAAVVLQCSWKRYICMTKFRKIVHKIIIIQSVLRCFVIRKQFLQLQKSVRYTQQLYRGKLQMRNDMKRFAEIRKSAIVIQSFFRMVKQYRFYRNVKKAVRVIEECYKAKLEKRLQQQKEEYLAMQRAAITIQNWYRLLIKTRKVKQEYQQLKSTVISIQKLYRAKIVTRTLRRNKAATKIQVWYRATKLRNECRANYLRTKSHVVCIQKSVRMYLLHKKYLAIKRATITIQTHYRSYVLAKMERQRFLQLKSTVISIQKLYRAKLVTRTLRHNKAATKIQVWYRATKLRNECRANYLRTKSHVVYIQKSVRMYLLHKKYLAIKRAAIAIQTHYRSYVLAKMERQRFLQLKSTVISIQKLYRAKIVTRIHRRNKAATNIQVWYRATKLRNECRSNYLRTVSHVICIQKSVRMYLLRKRYLAIKRATITIQKYYRSYVLSKIERYRFLKLKTTVIKLQALCRGNTIRRNIAREKAAAIVLQKYFRMWTCKFRLLKLKSCVRKIEQWYKSIITVREAKCMLSTLRVERKLQRQNAAVVIQRSWKRYVCMKVYHKTVHKITIVQSIVRSYIIRKRYLQLKKSATFIQNTYRGKLRMRIDMKRYAEIKKSAIVIQSNFRMMRQYRTYRNIKKAVKFIEDCYKTKLEMRRKQYLALQNAAVTIQNWFRLLMKTIKAKQEYQQLKTTVIFVQKLFRAKLVTRALRRDKAATKIQVWYRATKERNVCRKNYLQTISHVVCIQKTVRMFLLHKRYLQIKTATITIQTYYRSYILTKIERTRYLQLKNSVIRLQSLCRGYIIRQKVRRDRAAIIIQKTFKMYTVRCSFLEYKKRITFIQKLWRMRRISNIVRAGFLQKREMVIKLQAVIRGYLVREHIKAKKELMIKTREEQRKNWAASKIQALFRGHKARLSVSNDHRVAELRRRWREGGLQSTQESLKERHEGAIEIIKSTYDMEAIICAFRSLDFLTEVLPMTYNTTAVPFVLRVYTYMSAMNRSLPCIEVLKSAASLLVNLTRYNITGPKIYSRENIPLVLKLMLRFSNSESQLFCILCTHLWLFSKYDAITKDLSEFLHSPENHRILVNIKNSIDRLKRMSCNVKDKNSSTLAKYNANQSFNSSVCKSNIKIVYPALLPDYGLTRSDKPRYFIDPQQAITCLFQTYKL